MALCAIGALGVPVDAQAQEVRDDAGRSITFDVRAPGADVAGYAGILRTAVHGDEMQGLTVRVVPVAEVRAACRDARAAGCYTRGRNGAVIMIPPRPAARMKAVLLHEYGHHIDATRATPRWWAARRMSWRLATGQVVRDYSRGWSRSVGEVFAEDYVSLHMSRSWRLVRWLPTPSRAVLRALRRDITGRPVGAVPPPEGVPGSPPGGPVISRSAVTGPVGRGQVVEAAIAIDAPDRTVHVTVAPEPSLGAVPVVIEFTCDGMAPGAYRASPGETSRLRAGPLGPGACRVRVTGPAGATGGAAVEMVVAAATPGG